MDSTEAASEDSDKLSKARSWYPILQVPGRSSRRRRARWHVKVPKTILMEVPDSIPPDLSCGVFPGTSLREAVRNDQSLLSREKNRRASPREILPKRRMRLPLDHDPRFRLLHVGHRPARSMAHQTAVAES